MAISRYRALLVPLPCSHFDGVPYVTSGVYDVYGVKGMQRLSRYSATSGPAELVDSALYPGHRFVGWLHQANQAVDIAFQSGVKVRTLQEDWPSLREGLFLEALLAGTLPDTECGEMLMIGLSNPITPDSPFLEYACEWINAGEDCKNVLFVICSLSGLENVMQILEQKAESCRVIEAIAPIFHGRRPSSVGLVISSGIQSKVFTDYMDILGRLNYYESEIRPSRDKSGNCLDCRVMDSINKQLFGNSL